MRKKLPHEENLETLLSLVEKEQIIIKEEEKFTSDIVLFLSTFGIKPGRNVILKRFLYELYKSWSNYNIEYNKFSHEVSKYLLIHQKGQKLFYLINKNYLKINKELYNLTKNKLRNKTKSPPYKRHFENFLEHYKIKAGNYWVESFVLYHLYDKWIYEINKKVNYLGERQFFNFCLIYFQNKRRTSDKHQWFGVDESIKQFISDSTLNNLRESRKHVKKTIKKK